LNTLNKSRLRTIGLLVTLIFFLFEGQASAYVGPGAGFALLTSFFAIFVAFLLAFLSIISWPIRILYRLITGKNAYKNSRVKRVVIVGLDGLDPEIAENYMKANKLPNLSKLKAQGGFYRLKTTTPSISPVAWSSFATGVNPGRHNIFDFLARNKRSYLPELSSVHIGQVKHSLSIGKFVLPIGKPNIQLLRKSKTFWKILGDHGIFSNILRVPLTFPPEKFNGLLLSGMCVPDIKGTQGSFTYYTSKAPSDTDHTGGMRIPVEMKNNRFESYIPGPPNPISKEHEELRIPIQVDIDTDEITISVQKDKYTLKKGQYSDWISLSFKAGPLVTIRGIGRFFCKTITPEIHIYLTPVNLDPDKPALPISHPKSYASYLSKLQGSFATLGLAEDTWALNEQVIDEDAFIRQTYDIHDEREQMFFNALDRTDRGLLACVFDTTDRIQHEFLRFLEPGHPATRGFGDTYNNVIEELYVNMDKMVGRVIDRLDDQTVLMVMSDHGFKQFTREINLNTWLHQNGYLKLKEGADGSKEWLGDVDWSGTRAYAMGLAGIYMNIKGRESQGIVNPGEEAEALKKELIRSFTGLPDPKKKQPAINRIYSTTEVLNGPYLDNAPDLIVGYNPGYRAAWDSVTGKIGKHVLSDNEKAWGADHCIDPEFVPGVLFTSIKINNEKPAIIDIAPTVLELFGIPVPKYMEGKSLIK